LARSSAWEKLTVRPLEAEGMATARELFAFVGAGEPPAAAQEGWGAYDAERIVGALVIERAGGAAMLHGPAVVAPAGADTESAVEAAAQLVEQGLVHATAARIDTVFVRPQGLDRVWVRLGFIPVPEAELAESFRGRPGIGLFGWRGGSALWSAAARGRDRRTSPAFR
jgi:hypothetical protein